MQSTCPTSTISPIFTNAGDPGEGVVWGDARVGNMCFADDLSVAALFDWEGATTGPPGIDLGWWLMFDRYLCEAQRSQRLDGIPGREQTIVVRPLI